MVDIQKEIEKKFPNMNKKDTFLKNTTNSTTSNTNSNNQNKLD